MYIAHTSACSFTLIALGLLIISTLHLALTHATRLIVSLVCRSRAALLTVRQEPCYSFALD